MSTFGGRFGIKGFENVCIDNFTRDNYDCTAFFLSHFHSDHMRGIWDSAFHVLFEKDKVKLYCSEITRRFLLNCEDMKIPSNKICALGIEETEIELTEDAWVIVRWLPTGHCPGSIMFLFEGFGKRVLYTGDFRMSINDLSQLSHLHYDGEPLPIDHLFLDTTFASEKYLDFPTRKSSLQIIKQLVDDWLNKNEENRVVILSPAWIGIEYLMVNLYDVYKQKIHVSDRAYERFLSAIEMLEQIVTTDTTMESRIHFCGASSCGPCFRSMFKEEFVLVIKPTALYFTQEIIKEQGNSFMDPRQKFMRVAYSSHSSCQELMEFVRYLNPVRIHPCAIPPHSVGMKFFEDFLHMCSRKRADENPDEEIDELTGMTEMEMLFKELTSYVMRPVTLPPSPDKELIRRLGVETPT